MPETERTDFSTPIPLRDNGTEQPNPWSRLEAARIATQRVSVLAELVGQMRDQPLSRVGMAGVLDAVAADLRACLRGDLDAVHRVRDSAPLSLWAVQVARIVWPPAGLAAGPLAVPLGVAHTVASRPVEDLETAVDLAVLNRLLDQADVGEHD